MTVALDKLRKGSLIYDSIRWNWYQINDLMDNYINIFPFLEPYKAQLFPKIREIYHLLYGAELPETINKAMTYSPYVVLRIFHALVMDLAVRQEESVELEWNRIIGQSLGVNVNQKATHCDGEKHTHAGIISGLPERASSP
jgi:hypothetical protein